MSPPSTANWHHQFITIQNIRLHYVTQGSGPLMLLLHGFPEFWYAWRHQIPVFAEHYTVVALDLRGYNDSDKPAEVSAYAMPELIKDIEGVITGLGYERCVLVGHDWGGAIAWQMAYNHPECIEKLIILNCPHPQRFAEGWSSLPMQWLRSLYIGFFQLPWLPETILQMNDYQFIAQAFEAMTVNRSAISETDIQTYKTAIAKPGALTAGLNYYRNLLNGSQQQQAWPILEVPTLLIWGEDDPAFEQALAEETEKYVRDFHLRFISNCGHWVSQEYPDLVNQYMAAFLKMSVLT
ncbi:MAG: alpha/beta hydrolase [Leptolyngbya sp. SIO1D8]|nr:alpha/beta hydrolase [Leptolyngbya sp. SIO1D8]